MFNAFPLILSILSKEAFGTRNKPLKEISLFGIFNFPKINTLFLKDTSEITFKLLLFNPPIFLKDISLANIFVVLPEISNVCKIVILSCSLLVNSANSLKETVSLKFTILSKFTEESIA